MSVQLVVEGLLAALPAAAAAYVLARAMATARTSQPARDAESRRILRYSRIWVVLFAICVALAAFLAAVTPEVGWSAPLTTRAIVASAITTLIIGATGIYGLLEFAFVSLSMGDAGLYSRSPWSGRISIAWEAVHSVTYSRLGQWFKIQGKDGSRIYASVMLLGISALALEIRAKVPADRINAKTGFLALGLAPPEVPNPAIQATARAAPDGHR